MTKQVNNCRRIFVELMNEKIGGYTYRGKPDISDV